MSENHARATTRRRLPVWVWVVAGALLVGIAGTAALLMVNRGGSTVPPEAEVVTLPVPTPTVTAIEREPGTAFYDALPSQVLAFALADSAEAADLVAAGALEAYRMDYTDGSQGIEVQAGQWPTAEEASAVYDDLVAAAAGDAALPTATPTQTDDESGEDVADDMPTATATPQAVEDGTVLAAGAKAGRYTMVSHADGSGMVVWTNGTVVLSATGPLDSVRDVYTAFPL